ncbi:Cyclic-AMP phosphodiesterase class-II [Penicillium lagena]|uniref:Cyclic-AMP phosphodiesterase class-II n=1 Tax=Penicillium lagena TaxID=94218 RepID=UPI0025405F7F|nr:Cyclic-AMP phosphodiesterase class-II [Penicillium lagena]KAJ5624971.1 Cyclic-AMP phosphodiesterase class-II [Penicillium lagena]
MLRSRFYSPARSPRILPSNQKEPILATVESSAFFLRDHRTGNEIIVFGDVEPDSVSLEGHNKLVWDTAAPKIAAGTLRAIFIECSYNDSVDDAYLYGHMCPRHLAAELTVLAAKVVDMRESAAQTDKKRKRSETSGAGEIPAEQVSPKSKRSQSNASGMNVNVNANGSSKSRNNSIIDKDMPDATIAISARAESFSLPDSHGAATAGNLIPSSASWADSTPLPLAGLSIYIIHIKDHLTDGPPPGDRILRELRGHGEAASLGCEFFIPDPLQGIWI